MLELLRTPFNAVRLVALALSACALPTLGLSQAVVSWGAPRAAATSGDVASGGEVVLALNGLVFAPYLSNNPSEDTTVEGVVFDATNFLGAQFPNETPGSFIANHTSGDGDYDQLLGNASSCDAATLGSGSTNASANFVITGLTVNEGYLIQVWYCDVRGPSDARAVTIDGAVTIQSGVNADPSSLGEFAVGTFTANATTQSVNFDTAGTSGRAAISAIMVRVDEGSVGSSYCMPAVPNTTGAPASLFATGSSAAADNDLTLTSTNLPPQTFGFFLASMTAGFTAQPGGSAGNLCLGGSIGRYFGPGQVLNSGADGSVSLPLDLTSTPQPLGSVSIVNGERWYFQTWYRDADPGGGASSNFSVGLQIDFQ